MIVGIVLAAGQGSRFGGDKLLHPVQVPSANEPVAMGLQSALNLQPYVDEVICVVRPDDSELIKLFLQQGFKVCPSENYLDGLSASLMAGIRASAGADMWWLALGDMPFITAPSYLAIQQEISQQLQKPEQARQIVQACSQDSTGAIKSGHPVIFPQRLKAALLELSGDEGARSLVKKEGRQVQRLLLSDTGIHWDVDKLVDLKAL